MRQEIIRFEPFINAYLAMYQGEYFQISRKNIQELLNGLGHYQLVEYNRFPSGAFSMPLKIQIQATKKCNLKCITCAVAREEQQDAMRHEDIQRLLKYLASSGVLNIEWSGGEPLMRKGFFNLAELAWSLGFGQNIFTNGLLFDKENVNFIKRYFFRIQVSLDGIGSLYDKIVGRKTWSKFEKVIKLAVASRMDKLLVATVLQGDNVEQIGDIVDFCASIGIPRLRISMQVPIGRSSALSWQYYSNVINCFRRLWPEIKERALTLNLPVDCFLEKTICEDDTVADVGNLVSPGGYSFLYIDADGNYFPFPFLTSAKLKLGSFLNNDDLHEIWVNSGVLNFLRRQTYKNTGCGNCRLECSFHERALVYAFTGKLDAPALPHPECQGERR